MKAVIHIEIPISKHLHKMIEIDPEGKEWLEGSFKTHFQKAMQDGKYTGKIDVKINLSR